MKAPAANTTAARMPAPDIFTPASRLCASCGMCCNGVMFHLVKLQPADSPKALAALGLKLKRKRRQDCIQQPCPAHRDCRCSIYEERPVRCRVFECRQLQRVTTGAITEEAALAKINCATSLVAEVNALLSHSGGTNLKQPLSKRCETAMAEPLDSSSDGDAVQIRGQLADAMQKLNALLDQEFRIAPAEPPE